MGGKKKSKKKRRFPGDHVHVNDYERFSKAKQREAELEDKDRRGKTSLGEIISRKSVNLSSSRSKDYRPPVEESSDLGTLDTRYVRGSQYRRFLRSP